MTIDLMRICALLFWVVCVLGFHEAFAAEENRYRGPLFVPGEVLVKFKHDVSRDAGIGLLRRELNLAVLSVSRFSRVQRVRVSKGLEKAWIGHLKKDRRIEYVEPNYMAWTFMQPNDPKYPRQWHLDDQDNPYGGENGGGINIERAWDLATGAGVTVAVIDTGVAYEDYEIYKQAPDLSKTSFVPGYDFVNDDEHANDDNGHGTHVAGTIAQSTNNGVGVAGVAFAASIMPVKVLGDDGGGNHAQIAEGIYFAADHGADVINLSLGSKYPSLTLKDAVQYAYEQGVTIVAAAGNSGANKNKRMYPAGYDDYVIAVGATKYDQKRAVYSNHGSYVDIAAPGGYKYLDQNGDGEPDGVLQQTILTKGNPGKFRYKFMMGTSMASPHVAGVAALIIGRSGRIGPEAVREALEATAEEIDDEGLGTGIVDAHAAVTYSFGPVHDMAITALDAPAQATTNSSVSIDVRVSNQGSVAGSTTVSLTDKTNGIEVGSVLISLPPGATDTVNFQWDTAGLLGDHDLVTKASAVPGESDLTNNIAKATVTVKAAEGSVFVEDILMELRYRVDEWRGVAHVRVVDGALKPVAAAQLSGNWSLEGALLGKTTDKTDTAGVATPETGWREATSGDVWQFCVEDIEKSGLIYAPQNNAETCDTIKVP